MGYARAVTDLKFQLLQSHGPPSILTCEMWGSHEVLEGLVVTDDGEPAAMQIVTQCFTGPNHCKHLTLIRSIIALMLVKGSTDAADHVLITVIITLTQDSRDALVGEVSVQDEGPVPVGMTQHTPIVAQLMLDPVQRLLVLLSPTPGCVMLKQLVQGIADDGQVGDVTAVVVDEPQDVAQLREGGGGRQIGDGSHLGLMWGDADWADIVAQVLHHFYTEDGLIWMYFQIAVTQHG
jgi:hypothetical protein